ncbi:MAG: ABC transporter ATP-binding protein [Anaerovoracaceae bacterium]
MNIIETKNLTKYYGKPRGILDINLAVEEGEIFGFIGPNGAGKSTTIRTLLGLISPTSGKGKILGLDCQKDKKEILSLVGYMPSEAMFYDDMRVDEIIKFSAKLHNKDCKIEAATLCERLELDAKKKIRELSLGNRKKVAIVCALQHDPKVYILDEPTSGLDPLMQKLFFDLLHEKNNSGATIFLSSHVLSEIQRHCNRAAIIRNGEIITCDTVANLSQTSARKVHLNGITDLQGLVGVREVVNIDDGVSFLYNGDIKLLISWLNDLPVKDVTITEPDLDEIFMHFYQKEGK